MPSEPDSPRTIDAYIANFPQEIQQILEKLRAVIHQAAPDAREAISYAMPTFKLAGNLVHFAAYKNHIGFYPTPSGIAAFKEELAAYASSKGALQFPPGQPIPYELVTKIVQYRVRENLDKAKNRKKP